MKEYLKHHLAQTVSNPIGLEIVSANGPFLYDDKGKQYVDMISGVGVSSLGHGLEEIKTAIKDQVDRYMHVMVYGEFIQHPQLSFAEKLTSLLPESLNTCYFVNSGTEAVEAALKLARRISGRTKVMGFKGSYHGNTLGSLSVSHNEQKKYAFRPLLPGVEFIELNNYSDLNRITEDFACVILETIQGDAGIRIPTSDFMQALVSQCNSKGVLLILDEIQAGIGRTGRFCAFEHFGIVPDMLVLGKALGGGLPVGALITSSDHMSKFTFDPPLGHITTFGGHPVVCASGLAALNYITDHKVIIDVERKGQLLYDQLISHPKVKEIRHKGLFFAVELESDQMVNDLVFKALDNGLITFWFLSCPNSFRLAPPINISDQVLLNAGQIIIDSLNSI